MSAPEDSTAVVQGNGEAVTAVETTNHSSLTSVPPGPPPGGPPPINGQFSRGPPGPPMGYVLHQTEGRQL